tara:strand:+ start:5746 stop:8931 length:3186 start_codon:yes stop_codon:yes gene_type:complete
MLSVSSIGSSSGAAEYYGKDDYYVTGEADTPGLEWGGKGSAKIGLQGKAEGSDFKQVLQGTHPAFKDGDKTPGGADPKHRAGWDLTFSAPKSVSLAILVGGDRRLDIAHNKAVDRAMAYAEKHFAITRVRDQGKIREVNTGNLVYAKTVHGTSRQGDPQRHTHVVVANATVEPSTGKVRALESYQLFKHIQLVGRIYRAELAQEAMKLGYDVRRDAKTGTFELASFGEQQLRQFSKRREQIEAAIAIEEKKRGGPLTGAQKDALALRDRPKKLDTPRAELVARWAVESKAAGLDADRVVSTSQERGARGVDVTTRVSGVVSDGMSRFVAAWKSLTGRAPGLTANAPYSFRPRQLIRDNDARAAVSYGLQVAEQGKAVFTRHEVVGRALDFAVAGMTADRLEKQLSMLASDGRVKPADARMHGGITTASAIALEERLIAQVQAGKGKAAQIMSGPAAAAALSSGALQNSGGITLNEGQRQAAEKLLSSPDRFVGVQGFAGVGKTTMFRVVRALSEKAGVEIAGLAPTHKAAQELKHGAGITSNTVEKFLAANERVIEKADQGLAKAGLTSAQEKWRGKTLLVDESSMLSNAQADRLLRVADRVGVGRVIFIGDEKQLGSPEAGAPWRLLLNEGLDHARMTEIRRQNDPEIKAAVEHLAKGAPAQGLRALGSRVVQVGKDASDDKLAGAAFAAWAAVRDAGGNAPVIVPTHALREKVSTLIRADLTSRGELGGTAHTIPSLSHVRMTRAEAHRAASYQEGQILVLHSGIRDAGLTKGAHVTIVGRDERNERLVVSPDGKRQTTIDLVQLRDSRMSKFETYRAKELEVRSGDSLVWERRDEDRGFKTGERFTVETISGTAWSVRTEDGKQHQLKADDPALKFTGHAYAETADRSQGSTYQHVVAVLASTHGEGANQARAYVQASRSADSLTFVTNDLALLSMRLNRQDGQNMIASHEARDALSAQDASAGRELSAIALALDGAPVGPDTMATLKADGLDGSTKEPSDLAKATGADGPDKEDGSDKPLPGTLEADKPKDSEPAKEAEKDKSFDKAVEINSPAMGL